MYVSKAKEKLDSPLYRKQTSFEVMSPDVANTALSVLESLKFRVSYVAGQVRWHIWELPDR